MNFAHKTVAAGVAAALFINGCALSPTASPPSGPERPAASAGEPTALGPIAATNLQAGRLVPIEGRFALAGARNETLGFAVRFDRGALDPAGTIRLTDFARTGGPERIPAASGTLGQIVDVPVDLNRAGFVRQNGEATAVASGALPRAILPLPATPRLQSLRPETPGEGSLLWVDLDVPTQATPGEYVGSVEIVDGTGRRVIARLPVHLTVYDLVLPADRSLTVVGEVTWPSLEQHFTDAFEAITPKLINRTDARYKRPVAVLDGLVSLAQRHRVTLTVDRLQPTVKWSPFDVDWRDFDSLVGPWLDVQGSLFPDREPLSLWPLPTIDYLSNYPASSQREFYANAALHFDAKDWLTRAPVWIDPTGEPDSGPARQRVLERAANVLAAHTRVRVAVPLAADELRFAEPGQSGTLPSPEDDNRLITAGPGLVYNTQIAPVAARGAPTFLRTDRAGLIPFAGAGGDERDVRVWAWLAYVRNASILRFDNVLPRAARPDVPADPNELTWFYPGRWFGSDAAVVPSLQLKWLRRAEQDHEYLALANARGWMIEARIIARLLTKPVQIQAAQYADPSYALMSGTADPKVWDAGMRVLAQQILLRPPGQQAVDPERQNANALQLLQWAEPQEKPLLIGRTTLFTPPAAGSQAIGVRTFVDVYNPSDTTPRGNQIAFASVPRGWTVAPEPQGVPPLAAYQVARFGLSATVSPDDLDPRQRGRVNVEFTNGYNKRVTPCPLIVPIAATRRREGNLAINGSLEDWSDDDALCLASPLVRMIDRPTLQAHAAAEVATPSSVYSAWSDNNLYLAFKVGGLTANASSIGQNFVRYDFRRAWGEDLVEVLVQAVYADGSLGPVLHVTAKPNGGQWSERKLDLREGTDDAWEPLESGVRYAYSVDRGDWRGEFAIPWRAIHPANYVEGPGRLPVMLRFNFVQHQHATGTSASWAGPIDHGRDDLFTGALVLRNDDAR